MPRPQKYTDSEISAVVQAMIAEGGEVNPMRVRMRLGGGNVSRIKAVIAGMPRREALLSLPPGLPPVLTRELQRVSAEALQRTLSVVASHLATSPAQSPASARQGNASLRKHIEALESAAVVASERLVQAEAQRDTADRALKQVTAEKADLAKNFANLQAALRNAESDFRAAQRTIDSFERNRREDRDEIRSLQKRIEALVDEIATLKAKAPGDQQKVGARRSNSSSSRRRRVRDS
jgi:chromosome segregation ATPase